MPFGCLPGALYRVGRSRFLPSGARQAGTPPTTTCPSGRRSLICNRIDLKEVGYEINDGAAPEITKSLSFENSFLHAPFSSRERRTPLRSQVSPLRSQVSPLRFQVSPLRSQVSPLRSQVSGLRSQVTSIPSVSSCSNFPLATASPPNRPNRVGRSPLRGGAQLFTRPNRPNRPNRVGRSPLRGGAKPFTRWSAALYATDLSQLSCTPIILQKTTEPKRSKTT